MLISKVRNCTEQVLLKNNLLEFTYGFILIIVDIVKRYDMGGYVCLY